MRSIRSIFAVVHSFAAAAGVLAVAHLCLAQGAPTDSTELVRQLRAGNNEASLEIADKLLAEHPEDCRLLSLKGIALQNLKRLPDALASFQKAVGVCQGYLPALEGSAQVEYALQSPDTISTLQKILELQPDNATAHAMMAVTLEQQGRCAEALSHFDASSSLFDQRPDLLQGSASCHAQAGDLPRALDLYLALMNARPTDAVRYDVALLQWKVGKKQEALDTLGVLLSAGTDEPAFRLASRIAEDLGDTPRAVELLQKAIQLAPDKVESYLDFATIAFSHNSFQVGVDMLNAGLQRLPGAAPLYLARGVMEVQLTKNDAAIKDFELAHKLDPKLSFAIDAMGMMSNQAHNDAASLDFFKAQAKDHPDDPLLHYLLAEQLGQAATEGDEASLKAAIAAARRAAELEPTYKPSHDLLATLYLRAKQPELAIAEAELALRIDPNDDAALYQELMAKRRLGDSAAVSQLTARLREMREANAKASRNTDHYRLQDNVAQ